MGCIRCYFLYKILKSRWYYALLLKLLFIFTDLHSLNSHRKIAFFSKLDGEYLNTYLSQGYKLALCKMQTTLSRI